jgi:hypothetical protein
VNATRAGDAAPTVPRDRRLGPRQLILGAGALAGAISAILALTGTVQGWFRGAPEGSVSTLAIMGVQPLTYGEWRRHERAGNAGVPSKTRNLPGQMVTYNVDTAGYAKNTLLAVRLIRYDQSTGRSSPIEGNPIRVVNGPDCGCADWVRTPRRGHRYALEIEIYPPGPISGSPLRTATTEPFTAS